MINTMTPPEHTPAPSQERPFTRPGMVAAADLAPGDLVQFMGEMGRQRRAAALVLGLDDVFVHTLHLTGRSAGEALSSHLGDVGLARYPDDGHSWSNTWNDGNYTVKLDGHISPTVPTDEKAEWIQEHFLAIERWEQEHGIIVPAQATFEETALRALAAYKTGAREISAWSSCQESHPLAVRSTEPALLEN